MLILFRYIQYIWLNQAKIYLANPENLPLLYVGAPVLFLFFLSVWYLKLKKRPDKTYASQYSTLMDLRLWLGMVICYGLVALAVSKPMLAKSSFETSLGPVEVTFLVDLSLSTHLKPFGESGPTGLEIAKAQILGIGKSLKSQDQASVIYFARSAHEAYPMFPLNQSLRPLFNRAVEEIQLPEKLKIITTYNPTLNFVDSTDIASALQETYRLYDQTQKLKNQGYVPGKSDNRLVIILSDGDFNLDPSGARSEAEITEMKDYLNSMSRALKELKKRGMDIYAIGIGSRTGVPLVNALKKYKKDEDYDLDYYNDIVQRGLSRVLPFNLKLLVEGTGGNPNSDVIILDSPGEDAREFMSRAIEVHRRGNQARTVESRNDEPLWKSAIILALAVGTLSLAGWRIFFASVIFFSLFGGYIIHQIPIVGWFQWTFSMIFKSLV